MSLEAVNLRNLCWFYQSELRAVLKGGGARVLSYRRRISLIDKGILEYANRGRGSELKVTLRAKRIMEVLGYV